jgi:hypothetical protein
MLSGRGILKCLEKNLPFTIKPTGSDLGLNLGLHTENDCIRGRPRPALALRPSMIYCASPSISALQQSYTSDEV